ncbi:MAG: GYD domain-containing protein [Candidatus Bathyarchaeia archaeon]
MIFITLARWRRKPTKAIVAESSKLFERFVKEGGKILGIYWTLGRYDAVVITEGPDEKAAIKTLLRWGDLLSTETLVAVPREEAHKLLEE